MTRHGSFVATGMLPAKDLATTSAVDEDDDGASSSGNSTSSAPAPSRRTRDVLSQSVPVQVSNNPYPAILLYKTRKGSIMRVATLDDSIRSARGRNDKRNNNPSMGRSLSMPDPGGTIKLSQSDSAAMRSATDAVGGVLKNKNKTAGSADAQGGEEDVNNARIPRNRSVMFGNLEIREYARTIGCNPSVSAGPPVGLDWTYDPDPLTLDLEEYESSRGPRRSYAEMAMPRAIRQQLLSEEWGVKRPAIASAIRESNRIKQSRRRTVNNLDTPMEKVEYQLEKAKRNTSRILQGKKTARVEYETWKEGIISQWQSWAAERAIEEENAASAAAEQAGAAQGQQAPKADTGVVIDEDEALNLSEHSSGAYQTQVNHKNKTEERLNGIKEESRNNSKDSLGEFGDTKFDDF